MKRLLDCFQLFQNVKIPTLKLSEYLLAGGAGVGGEVEEEQEHEGEEEQEEGGGVKWKLGHSTDRQIGMGMDRRNGLIFG